jgi:hypothetical protein
MLLKTVGTVGSAVVEGTSPLAASHCCFRPQAQGESPRTVVASSCKERRADGRTRSSRTRHLGWFRDCPKPPHSGISPLMCPKRPSRCSAALPPERRCMQGFRAQHRDQNRRGTQGSNLESPVLETGALVLDRRSFPTEMIARAVDARHDQGGSRRRSPCVTARCSLSSTRQRELWPLALLLLPQGNSDGARPPSDRQLTRVLIVPMHGTQRVRPSGASVGRRQASTSAPP